MILTNKTVNRVGFRKIWLFCLLSECTASSINISKLLFIITRTRNPQFKHWKLRFVPASMAEVWRKTLSLLRDVIKSSVWQCYSYSYVVWPCPGEKNILSTCWPYKISCCLLAISLSHKRLVYLSTTFLNAEMFRICSTVNWAQPWAGWQSKEPTSIASHSLVGPRSAKYTIAHRNLRPLILFVRRKLIFSTSNWIL